jgi:hypothetical protein
MHFKKQDMEVGNYYWQAASWEEVFSGPPSRRLFDRFNGNQVLFIINSYAEMFEEFSTEEGKMIEKEISDNLPLDARSEISVLNWICSKNLQTSNKK